MLEAELPLVLLAREGWYRGRSVAVLVEELEAAGAALDAAARVARQSVSPLTVLLAVGLGPAGAGPSRLQERGIERSNVLLIGGTALPGIEQAARACQARLLVAPSPARPEDTQALGELLRRFPGALLLVGR